MTIYIESSAAGKLLVEEAESHALALQLDDWRTAGEALVSSTLLETELRRLATRTAVDQVAVSVVLAGFSVASLDRSLFREAGLLPGAHLRSLDALHVAAAVRANARAMITYDVRQGDAARAAGLEVLAPA